MKILRTLNRLLEFFLRQRGSGTTSFVTKIAKENDCYLIVADADTKHRMLNDQKLDPRNVISLYDFVNKHNMGLEKKPILIDNHALMMLLEESLDGFELQQLKINKKIKLIDDIQILINKEKLS